MHFSKHSLRLLMTVLLVGLSGAVKAETRITRQEYIDLYKDIAIQQMIRSGIPASITLAQACLESGDGNSYLAKEANNHFGIKCHDWTGATIRYDDDRKKECFRKYDSAEESFFDHSEFLTTRHRYRFLFDLDRKDYKSWAEGLKEAGYATDPKYAKRLIEIIEDYELYRYDQGETGPDDSFRYAVPAESLPVKKHFLYKYSRRHQLYRNNKKVFIIASGNDSYASLAKEFCLFENEIRRFNDVEKKVKLNEGEIVYLQKKRNRARWKFRKIELDGSETLHSISQKYGIRQKRILEINGTDGFRKGATIRLR